MYPRLLQFVGQLIQMCGSAPDQLFTRLKIYFEVDGAAAVFPLRQFKTGLSGKSVDKPGLPRSVIPYFGEDSGSKLLAGICSVLSVQSNNIILGKIAEADRFRLDVEGGTAGDDFTAATVNTVIPDIADTAENDREWKVDGAVGLAGTQLTQN